MTRSQRVARVAALSKTAEQVAAQAMSISKAEVAQFEQQLADLVQYRNEYSASLSSGSATPLDGARAQEIRGFISQIESVIEVVERRLNDTAQRHDRERGAWVDQLRRAKALNGVVARLKTQEARTADNRRQREIDDRPRR
jgi:flagellar export protein FliJ